MIDALILVAICMALILCGTRGVASTRLLIFFFSAAMVAHALCLLGLQRMSPEYEYVIYPSPAAKAGLRGSGRVRAVNGEETPNLQVFFARALAEREARISAGKDFVRTFPADSAVSFWQALDSYALEDAAGGLALLPRHPIYRGSWPGLMVQFPNLQGKSTRLIAAHGQRLRTIGDLLAVLARIPRDGVISLQFMHSTPDTGVASSVFSYSRFDELGTEGRRPLEDLIQPHFRLSGKWIMRPGYDWQEAGGGVLVPRIALLPWLSPNPVLSFLGGISGSYLRQILNLRNLTLLPGLWPSLPKQHYLLDDPITAVTLLFKLSSLAVSLVLGLLAWLLACKVRVLAPYIQRHRSFLVFAVAMVLQIADFFVIRVF